MENEIILYQPDASVALEVRVERETVWLNRNQIATLFDRDVKTIGKHINNALREELQGLPVVAKFATTASDGKTYQVEYYNIEMITSVGYRVKSQRGILFRAWSNTVLKDYLLKGYSVNQRFERLEYRMAKTEEQVGLLIKSTLPPTEGIFFEGEVFDAYDWLNKRIKSAEKRIIILDPYADFTVYDLLSRKQKDVKATIYTSPINKLIDLDAKKYKIQHKEEKIDLRKNYTGHDRFLIIDDTVYHVGGSMKDLGNRLMAYSILHIVTPEELLAKIGK
ncbi:MAG: virulence RhuM family protein [Muribaculaceae bacterium]|nr:virulence RhuM family protein [Muribaculaceae bacterium]